MRIVPVLLALALASCAGPQTEPPDTMPARASGETADRVVGTVRIVGSAPMNVQVVVQPPEGRSLRLVGPLSEELKQLQGAEVAVFGQVEPAADPLVDRQIQVSGYEIVSVNDEPVVVGTVEGTMGDWMILRTATGETVYLSGATDQFQPGQKVWVQGPRGLIVQSYGVLKP